MAVFIVRPIIWKIVLYERRPARPFSEWFMIIEKIQTGNCVDVFTWFQIVLASYIHRTPHIHTYKWNYILCANRLCILDIPVARAIVNRYQLTRWILSLSVPISFYTWLYCVLPANRKYTIRTKRAHIQKYIYRKKLWLDIVTFPMKRRFK